MPNDMMSGGVFLDQSLLSKILGRPDPHVTECDGGFRIDHFVDDSRDRVIISAAGDITITRSGETLPITTGEIIRLEGKSLSSYEHAAYVAVLAQHATGEVHRIFVAQWRERQALDWWVMKISKNVGRAWT